MKTKTTRKRLIAGLVTACALAPPGTLAQTSVHRMIVWRDPGCGCCAAWAAVMQRSGRFVAALHSSPDMTAVKQRLRVPAALASCHTAEVAGLVIEGHVPAEDVLRLIAERPHGVLGLAVPGMPLGSPGMEAQGGRRDAFTVMAFRRDGAASVFARYPARH